MALRIELAEFGKMLIGADGKEVVNRILAANERDVVLDFTGVEATTTHFFDEIFGGPLRKCDFMLVGANDAVMGCYMFTAHQRQGMYKHIPL